MTDNPPETQDGMNSAVDELLKIIHQDREAREDTQPDELLALRLAAENWLHKRPVAADDEDNTSLRDAIYRLEVEHPNLTKAINDVANHLSGLGI